MDEVLEGWTLIASSRGVRASNGAAHCYVSRDEGGLFLSVWAPVENRSPTGSASGVDIPLAVVRRVLGLSDVVEMADARIEVG